ncbi:hypothetical protein BBP00_00007397, partial [Phytophthora kernoviae]
MLVGGVLVLGTAVTPSSGATEAVTSDPATAAYTVSAFAIGDWGTTPFKGSCCSRSDSYNNYDINAEDIVASLMNTQAGSGAVKPKAIIGHGDSFYWTGINSAEARDSRFTTTFEEKFDGVNLKGIPWVNVLGNHDYGGASFICNSGDNNVRCGSTEELLQGIDNKFKWQSEYTSPNDNRWVLSDHFYVYRIEDPASGVSVEIFNVDSNDADVHGAMQVCCQCYGYSNGDSATCRNAGRGHEFCCGGDTAMYDACAAKFSGWGDDSRAQLAEKVKSSTATWKVVNSHYGPYGHYAEAGMKKWFDVLQGSGVHLWLNGHTHGDKHDYSSSLGVHFVENGAGGGIQRESASGIPAYAAGYVDKNEWTYTGDEYGFFSVEASKEWLKLQYHTTDGAWNFQESFNATTIGIKSSGCELNYSALYPEWGETNADGSVNKIHLVGHSMGGQTVRMLAQMLEKGATGAPTEEDAISHPLFEGGKSWVHSVTTIASPNQGTTLADGFSVIGDGVKNALVTMLSVIGIAGDTTKAVFDAQLDQLFDPSFKDTCLWSLSVAGAKEESAWVETLSDIYYFSYATVGTFAAVNWKLKKIQLPDPLTMNPAFDALSLFLGSRYAPDKLNLTTDWQPNDGVVNTMSMSHDGLGELMPYSGLSEIGKWNQMDELTGFDHMDVTGFSLFSKIIDIYSSLAQLLASLPVNGEARSSVYNKE